MDQAALHHLHSVFLRLAAAVAVGIQSESPEDQVVAAVQAVL